MPLTCVWCPGHMHTSPYRAAATLGSRRFSARASAQGRARANAPLQACMQDKGRHGFSMVPGCLRSSPESLTVPSAAIEALA